MNDERSSEKNAATGQADHHRVPRRVRLVQKADTAYTRIESALEVQKAEGTNESEPWYFTHM